VNKGKALAVGLLMAEIMSLIFHCLARWHGHEFYTWAKATPVFSDLKNKKQVLPKIQVLDDSDKIISW